MGRILFVLGLATALLVGLWLWASRSPAPNSLSPSAPAQEPTSRESATLDDTPVPMQTTERESARIATAAPQARAATNDLAVRVVDPAGEAVGDVPLLLGPTSSFTDRPRPGDWIARSTDGSGGAVFADVRSRIESSLAARDPWMLVHDIPFEKRPSLVIDRAQLAEKPVVSVQPFSGVLEVLVHELEGAAAPDGTDVRVTWADGEDAEDPLFLERRQHWTAPTRGGSALFPCVELGRTWEVSASRAGSNVRSRARAAGPGRAHERTRIDVFLGADHPVVVFRAIDQNRQPLANVRLDVAIDQQDPFFQDHSRVSMRTDERGRFRLDLNAHTLWKSPALFVTAQIDERTRLSGRKSLTAEFEPGIDEGGDVMLSPEDTLVEGDVVDESGAPVAKAVVTADTEGWFGRNRETIRDKSDEHGRFALHGTLTNSQFGVRAEKDALRSPRIQVHEHDRGVRLVLTPYCTLSGKLLVDAGTDPSSIRFGVEDAEHKRQHVDVAGFREGGVFALVPIPAGVYDLVCDSSTGIQLAKVEHVVAVHDVDVGTIDLRGQVHTCEVTLLGADPAKPLSGYAAWRPSSSKEGWRDQGFDGDHIVMTTPRVPVDVWVRPDAYRGEVLRGVVDHGTMRLAPPLRVRLELRLSGNLPPAPFQIGADVTQDGQRVGFGQGSAWFTEPRRAVTFSVASLGRMQVVWQLSHRDDNGSSISGPVLPERTAEIDVRDTVGEQVFTVELDAEALAKLLSKPPY